MSFNALLNQVSWTVKVSPDVSPVHKGHPQALMYNIQIFTKINACGKTNSCITKMPCLWEGEFSIPNSPLTQGIHLTVGIQHFKGHLQCQTVALYQKWPPLPLLDIHTIREHLTMSKDIFGHQNQHRCYLSLTGQLYFQKSTEQNSSYPRTQTKKLSSLSCSLCQVQETWI